MYPSNFVLTVCADKQDVHSFVAGSEVLEEFERGAIKPLQIVHEEHERMFRSREYTHEAPQDSIETPLGLLRWEIRDGFLRADDQLNFGNKVDDELSIRAERPTNVFAPSLDVDITQGENRARARGRRG